MFPTILVLREETSWLECLVGNFSFMLCLLYSIGGHSSYMFCSRAWLTHSVCVTEFADELTTRLQRDAAKREDVFKAFFEHNFLKTDSFRLKRERDTQEQNRWDLTRKTIRSRDRWSCTDFVAFPLELPFFRKRLALFSLQEIFISSTDLQWSHAFFSDTCVTWVLTLWSNLPLFTDDVFLSRTDLCWTHSSLDEPVQEVTFLHSIHHFSVSTAL